VGARNARIQTLYTELGPALLAYARSILSDRSSAEDAVQQVFLKLLARRELEIPGDARPYLFRAVRNVSINLKRGAQRAARREAATPIFAASDGVASLVPALEAALAELPDEQREVLVLRIWGELTLDAAATVLGVGVSTAASRYRYALEKLRRRFAAEVRS
jgi:RNA polymerase sigma-70 factor (ECF subfamily)